MKKISMDEAVERLQKGEEVVVESGHGNKFVASRNSFFTVDTLHGASFYVESDEHVTISRKEYERLMDKVEFLNCLEACGVDNWHGYGEAWEMMESEGEEE